jgi:hypothetical protein
VNKIDAPADLEEKHWDEREIFECGHQSFGGYTERPCPSDPAFPTFEEYKLECETHPGDGPFKWHCYAMPKTDMARKLSLPTGYGKTRQEAEQSVHNKYLEYSRRYDA